MSRYVCGHFQILFYETSQDETFSLFWNFAYIW